MAKCKGLSGNQLKILALIAMTCDHVGVELLPQIGFLRIIGRIAFPIFAYMISEGCRYTKNRQQYLLSVAAAALICQTVFFFVMGSLRQSVLVTFVLSIGLIYLVDRGRSQRTISAWILAGGGLAVVWGIAVLLPDLPPFADFSIEYGVWGVLLPVMIYFGGTKQEKLVMTAWGLMLLGFTYGGVQWFALLALPLLGQYSGKRGSWRLKYFFYIYYPLHLVVIYRISMLLQRYL